MLLETPAPARQAEVRKHEFAADAGVGTSLSPWRQWRSRLCAADASAQKNQGPPNALQGFSQNRDQPVKIQAAALEVREKDKKATFSGDVHVVKATPKCAASRSSCFTRRSPAARSVKAAEAGPGGDKQIRRIEAKGGVVVTQKDQNRDR